MDKRRRIKMDSMAIRLGPVIEILGIRHRENLYRYRDASIVMSDLEFANTYVRGFEVITRDREIGICYRDVANVNREIMRFVLRRRDD